MEDKEFLDLMNDLEKYLEKEKVFIKDPVRYNEVKRATEIAKELFDAYNVAIKDDPLQMGALILRIDCYDLTVCGEREIKLFVELISKANNFEIYSTEDGIRFALVFADALIRIS